MNKRIYELTESTAIDLLQSVATDKRGNASAKQLTLEQVAGQSFASPVFWGIRANPNNPTFPLNSTETAEQYVPSPIQVGDDLYCYIKGDRSRGIYLYKSTNNGLTWSLQNNGNPVLAPTSGSFDEYVTDPCAVYDEEAGVIRLYYKGSTVANPLQFNWCVATTTPAAITTYTKAVAPIYTAQSLATDLGLSLSNMRDNTLSDVVLIDGVYHFYFYCAFFDANSGYVFYYLGYATGNSAITPDNAVTFLQSDQSGILRSGKCFRFDLSNRYYLLYDEGYSLDYDFARVKTLISSDGKTWQRDNGVVFTPVGGASAWNGIRTYTAAVLKKPTPKNDTTQLINGEALLFLSGSKQGGGDTAGVFFCNVSACQNRVIETKQFTNEALTITSNVVDSPTGKYVWLPTDKRYRRFQITAVASTNQATTGTLTVYVRRFFGNDALQLAGISGVTVPCGNTIKSRQGLIFDLEPRVTGFELYAYIDGGATSGTLYSAVIELLP